jgi:asparagine N-glycosylation enzyme membrane subunit Stt3
MRVHSSQLKFAVFVVVAWAAFQAALLLANPTSPIHGRLTDPDGYMRLVRVEELAHTHDWYDSTIARSNAPYGEELHWTRPFDVMILAGAAPLQPFLGTDRAIFWSGSLICPLLMLGVLFAVCWAAAPLVPDGKWLIVAALLVQPMLITDSLPGRFDHHILQILLFVILVGAAIRLCARPDRRMAVLAGASAAVGIWVSVEMLVPFVAIVAVFAIGWILDGRREKLRTVVEVTTSQAALLALALAVERSPGHWFDVDYDKVSIAYVFGSVVLAAASTAVYFATARTSASARGARIIVAGVAAAACFGALALAFPTALKGPEAGIDPAIRPIWLDHVTEMQPVFGTWPSVSGTFLQIAAQGTLAAFALVFILRAEWKTPKFFAWACVGSLLAIYLVSTYLHVRSGGFLAIVASVVIAR